MLFSNCYFKVIYNIILIVYIIFCFDLLFKKAYNISVIWFLGDINFMKNTTLPCLIF